MAQGGGDATFETGRERYAPGRVVVLTLSNEGSAPIELTGDWTIARAGETQANKVWAEHTTVAPGETRSWRWESVEPGRYVAIAPTSAGELRASFDIGRYYTIGFDQLPDEYFVVFARDAAVMEQMDAEAEAQAQDKTLIVSGIVRGAQGYNPDWSYVMGPGSIVLGEAFIEVCDASPHYVEENRSDWMGERWCPWSSYVAKRGRP